VQGSRVVRGPSSPLFDYKTGRQPLLTSSHTLLNYHFETLQAHHERAFQPPSRYTITPFDNTALLLPSTATPGIPLPYFTISTTDNARQIPQFLIYAISLQVQDTVQIRHQRHVACYTGSC
jgi:hypothetical protein